MKTGKRVFLSNYPDPVKEKHENIFITGNMVVIAVKTNPFSVEPC
jgi:hypothetical protein